MSWWRLPSLLSCASVSKVLITNPYLLQSDKMIHWLLASTFLLHIKGWELVCEGGRGRDLICPHPLQHTCGLQIHLLCLWSFGVCLTDTLCADTGRSQSNSTADHTYSNTWFSGVIILCACLISTDWAAGVQGHEAPEQDSVHSVRDGLQHQWEPPDLCSNRCWQDQHRHADSSPWNPSALAARWRH